MLGGAAGDFLWIQLDCHFATLRTQNVKQAFLGAAYRTPRMNLIAYTDRLMGSKNLTNNVKLTLSK